MEKNNKGLMVLVIILSLLVVGLFGYIVYDKVIDVEEDNNKVSDNKEEDNNKVADNDNINFDLARGYINDLIDLGTYDLFDRLSEEGLSDNVKLSMALSGSDNFVQSYTCGEAFTSNYAEGNEYRPVGHERWACSVINKEPVYSIEYDSVNFVYKSLFGNIGDVPKKIEYCSNTMCDYSTKTNSYVRLIMQASGLPFYSYYYNVKNVEVNDNELKIKISYLTYTNIYIISEETFDISYYLNDKVYEVNNKADIKKAYYDNEKTLPSLTFVFEKENQDYILKSVE